MSPPLMSGVWAPASEESQSPAPSVAGLSCTRPAQRSGRRESYQQWSQQPFVA